MILHQVLHSHWFQFFMGSELLNTQRPVTEPSPHYGSTTIINLLCLRVCTQSRPTYPIWLYHYCDDFNCATWSLFPEHNFRWWAKLTSIFLIIPFCLKQRAWFRVCVIPLVSVTFRFIIPLAWCHRRPITSSWDLSTNVSWSSSAFWALLGYQLNSWWEMPSLSPRWFLLTSTTFLHSLWPKTCSCFMLHLEFLPIQLILGFYLGVLPSFMSRMLRELLQLLILAIVILLTIIILPCSPCYF